MILSAEGLQKYGIAFCLLFSFIKGESNEKSFYIDYEKDTFVKDGKPFRYIAGSIHSYRMPKESWNDRLLKMWSAGLNAIDTYIFWNEHEPYPGVYDFEGQNNIFEFFEMAHKIGFLIVLRPGPYICGEHDYGGLPWWLLANGTETIRPRTNEQNYMIAVRKWFDVLLPKIKPYLYKNGGPVITVQIENEYGSLNVCDTNYTIALRDLFIDYLGKDVVYFTTDGFSVSYLKCGAIPGVHATVDFGVYVNASFAFGNQRQYAPKGPLINSEYYPGWLDIWGVEHQKVDTEKIIKGFHEMMSMNASINFYMYFGGTNFGFSNGADPPGFIVEPTSYDYDAPLTEAGDLTSKHDAIKEAISRYFPKRNVPSLKNSTKVNLGNIKMKYYVPLVKVVEDQTNKCVDSKYPLSFERLGQGYGFILYKTLLDDADVNGKNISIDGVRDRAYIQLGDASVGIMYREKNRSLIIDLPNNKDRNLYIFVENMGRLNFGNDLLDAKGILSNVTLDGKILTKWTTCLTDNFIPYYQKKLNEQDNKSFIKNYIKDEHLLTSEKIEKINFNLPALYIGEFNGADSIEKDTFLHPGNFTKGFVLIESEENVTNLGKYWPKVGPQVTLYTPGSFITPNKLNYVSFIEFEGSACKEEENCYVKFIDYPIIDGKINRDHI